ncbi:hypothetical protein V2O64_12650 [Verrucomicrobiaceae bacterium 227]
MREKICWWLIGGCCLLVGFLGKPREEAGFQLEEVVSDFESLHERTVEVFVSGESFGIYRLPTKDYWEERAAQIDGKIFTISGLNLIGTTEEEGERVYEEMIRFKRKGGMEKEGFRELDDEEKEAMRILKSGAQTRVELTAGSGVLRYVAPILAREDCLKCHEGEVGSLLGAFDYRLGMFERRGGE